MTTPRIIAMSPTFSGDPDILSDSLKGCRIIVLEDEFLIAMDVEQICRDNGATHVAIVRDLDDIDLETAQSFDAAIVDVMLGGSSTLEFAAGLLDAAIPFVFASGYTDNQELATKFPSVELISKPYSGDDLVGALARAIQTGLKRKDYLTGP
jgi:CheY-like chemotaxis protein